MMICIDILQLQEIEISEESFSECPLLSSSYIIIPNNSQNNYGTASILRSDLSFTNVKCDTAGRGLVFDIGDVTFGNFYCHSGTDSLSRASRENFCSETIPSLLTNRNVRVHWGGLQHDH